MLHHATTRNRPGTITALALALLATSAMLATTARDAHAEDVIDHGGFHKLLQKHVDGRGRVAYTRLRGGDARGALDAYVKQLGAASLKGKSRDARLAFYINAYNALVVQSVVTKWPVKSVLKVDGFFKKQKHTIAGRSLTLDELEHKIIRPKFKDARVHFVLVCGASDCPRLRRTAMTEKNVRAQLRRATREYIPKATKLRADGSVETSQLFNWFAGDFKRDAGSVPKYLAKHVKDAKLKAALGEEGVKITFAKYDWSLNSR